MVACRKRIGNNMGGYNKQSTQVDKVAQLAAALRADGEPSKASNNVPQLLACMRTQDLKVRCRALTSSNVR